MFTGHTTVMLCVIGISSLMSLRLDFFTPKLRIIMLMGCVCERQRERERERERREYIKKVKWELHVKGSYHLAHKAQSSYKRNTSSVPPSSSK